jgi:hypothetical protein
MAMTAWQAPHQPTSRRVLVKRRVVPSAAGMPGAPSQPDLA